MKKENYTDDLELDVQEEEILGVDEEIKLNHGESIGSESENDSILNDESDETDTTVNVNLILEYLRQEIARPEYLRLPLKFKYAGKKYSGTPLKEINSNRFIFLVNNKMEAFNLNEIEPV